MGKLLRKFSKILFQALGRFVIIIIILMGFTWGKREWTKLEVRKQEGHKFEKLLEDTNQYLQQAKAELGKHEAEWKQKKDAIRGPIIIQIEAIDHELRERGPLIAEQVKQFSTAEGQAILLKDAVDAARKAVDQAQGQINKHDNIPLLGSLPYSSARKLRLSAAKLTLLTAEKSAEVHDQIRTKLKGAISQSDVETLNQRRQGKEKELASATDSVSPEETILRSELKLKEETVDSLRETIQIKREEIANDPMQRAIDFMKQWISPAIGILAGCMLIPPALKAVCYYCIAPFASRVKPICVLPAKDVPPLPKSRKSLVSMFFDIGQGDEMLVHSAFLQSSSSNASKRTQALLNPSIPFSSIASGMYLLTRIRPASSESTRVFVSSQKDAFGEIGCIELPEGSAMVLHPRSLAGVIKRQGRQVRITRHWRLFNIHAWLTFQLRYLVFHGQCTLILKGCRGIRTEKPHKTQPREINQSITIGFSANLGYKNIRCEPFIPYLLGEKDLFDDLFSGDEGEFVYEEVPNGGQKDGNTGRGWEGVLDVILNGFGL